MTLPYVAAMADRGWRRAVQEDTALALGVNVARVRVVYPAVAEAHGLPCVDLAAVMS